ncbi:hypothetical protein ACFQ6E_29510 [Streptomyces sp. NPDC056462]|uniref:hypothetical protein n=1 Tax=Streptomyces sp. NPDC056462 TaxID=3345826 RepID=UPI0036C9CA7A
MPAPDARPDVRTLDPSPGTYPGPERHGGPQPMPAADTAPDPRFQAPTTPLTGPDPRIRAMSAAAGPSSTPATQADGTDGADDNGYGVSNAELGKMADELDLAAQILEKADKGLAESDTTARVHKMLTSGRMLKSTTGDWDDEITRLAKQCRSMADKMRQTHTNYTTQENRTARDFQAILASLEGDA